MNGQPVCSVKDQVIAGLKESRERVRRARELVEVEAPCQQILHETSAAQELLSDLQARLLYDRLRHCLFYIEGKDTQTTETSRQTILDLFAIAGRLPVPSSEFKTGNVNLHTKQENEPQISRMTQIENQE